LGDHEAPSDQKVTANGRENDRITALAGSFHVRLKTMKGYVPWVKSRQIALENSIEKAWSLSG
jgi:hypothetical protein